MTTKPLCALLLLLAGCAAKKPTPRPTPSVAVENDAQLAAMFERGWALYLSGDKERALTVFDGALKAAERAAGAPEGDRRLRVDPPAWIETYVVGDRVL